MNQAANWKLFFLFFNSVICLDTQKTHLYEMVLLSTQNTCFNWWVRKQLQINAN